MNIVVVLTGQNNIWTIYQVDGTDKYCLKHEGQIKQYYNDGVKENETYCFYKDVSCGHKKLIEFTKYMTDTEWRYARYENTTPHVYDRDWSLETSLTAQEIVPKSKPNYK